MIAGPLVGAPLNFVTLGSGGGATLQTAYDAGNTIATSGGRIVSITGPENLVFSSSSGGASASLQTTAGTATVTASAVVALDADVAITLGGAAAGQVTCAAAVEVRTAPAAAFQNVRAADPSVPDDLATKRYVDALPVGEANTASNLAGGVGLFQNKSGVDLEFRSLTSTGGTVTITPVGSNTVNLESAGGGGSLLTGNQIWVDAVNGNDGTGAVGNASLPFATPAAAIAVASAGDTVNVRPGTYALTTTLIIPAGVALIGYAWESTTFTVPGGSLFQTVQLSPGSVIENVTVEIPNGAVPAVGFAGASLAEVASIRLVTVFSTHAAANGIGFLCSGGKIIASELRWTGANSCDAFIEVTGGIFAFESSHLPNTATTINANVRQSGGRLQAVNCNCGATAVARGFDISGGVSVILNPNVFQVQTALYLDQTVDVNVTGGAFLDIANFTVEAAGTYNNASFVRLNLELDPDYTFPPAAVLSDFGVLGFASSSDFEPPSLNLLGTNVSFGFAAKGVETYSGEGQPYARGAIVYTATGATPATDGINFVDVTAAATSRSGSTFSFPTGAVGDCIYWSSSYRTATNTAVEHWGVLLDQVTGAVIPATSKIVIETCSNALAQWVPAPVMATSQTANFRYADQIMLRSNSTETIRIGVGYGNKAYMPSLSSLTDPPGLGTTRYWYRARVEDLTGAAAPLTTNPVFEQLRVLSSHAEISPQGFILQSGLSCATTQIFGQNTLGETGGVLTGNLTVGTPAGDPREQFTLVTPNTRLNGANDAVYASYTLPSNICTAFPVLVQMNYGLEGAGATSPSGSLSVLPIPTARVRIADPAGTITPIERAPASTPVLTARAPDVASVSLGGVTGAVAGIAQQYSWFTGYNPAPALGRAGWLGDVQEFYAGDSLAVRVQIDNLQGFSALNLISIAITSVQFTQGSEISSIRP
jgi:hypothetical protein